MSSILGTRLERWDELAACDASAQRLAAAPAVLDATIELHGPLGAGKTSFVRALLGALGVEGRIKSPTYALTEAYEIVLRGSPAAAWHFDFYRFDDPREWEDAGFREIFGSPGLKLVEWPEKAAGLLPEPDLRLLIDPVGETVRAVRLEAATPRGLRLLDAAGTR